jgi:hypothetical protein
MVVGRGCARIAAVLLRNRGAVLGQKPTFNGVEQSFRFLLEADTSLQMEDSSVRPLLDYPTLWGRCFVFATTDVADPCFVTGSCDPRMIQG